MSRHKKESIFNHWKQTKKAAQNFGQSNSNKLISTISIPKRGPKCSKYRVGFTFDFENPETEEMQTAGWFIDLSGTHSKESALNAIYNSIASWLFKFYEFKDLSFLKSKKFKNSVLINSLECI